MMVKPVIMVVDDSRFNVELLGAFLGERYDVCFAMSGEEAIEIAVDVAPDLVILDVVLPGMDGHQVCRQMRDMPELGDLPIIFSSGNNDASALEKGRAAGGTDFLAKPVRASALRDLVAHHIATAEARRPA